MKYLTKIPFRVARALMAGFYISVILTHLMIIVKIIPYDWVNGGRSASYELQLTQSILSAILVLIALSIAWKLSSPEPGENKHIIFIVMTIIYSIPLISQFTGTDFERYVMSIVLLTGVVSHAAIAKHLSLKK